ncbi:MAG: hypothetical protein QMC23_08030 [Rubritalea sp.]|jgi:hypothetical protein
MTAERVKDIKNMVANTPILRIPNDAEGFYILGTPDRENPTLAVKMEMILLKGHKPAKLYSSTRHNTIFRQILA